MAANIFGGGRGTRDQTAPAKTSSSSPRRGTSDRTAPGSQPISGSAVAGTGAAFRGDYVPPPNQNIGTTYEVPADHHPLHHSDRRDYMYGRDPMGAENAVNRMRQIAQDGSNLIQAGGRTAFEMGQQQGDRLEQAGRVYGQGVQDAGVRLEGFGNRAAAVGDAAAGRQVMSGAEALLRQGANQSNQQALALARSGRGLGASSQGMAEAQRANAATMQNVGNQATQLRAQEYAAQQGRNDALLGNMYGTASGAMQAGANTQTNAAGMALRGVEMGANARIGGARDVIGTNQQAVNTAFSGEQGAHNVRVSELQGGASRSQAVMQQRVIDSDSDASIAPAIISAGGTVLGAVGGAFVGGPVGAAGGAALGGAAGRAAYEAGSDVRAKENIRPVEGVAETMARLESLAREKGVEGTDMRPARAFSYEYKDPERFGEGRFVGPMAQDLEKSPATAQAVKAAPDGTKMVDTGRLVLPLTAAVGEQQRSIDEIFARLDEVAGNRERPETVASDERAKKKVTPYPKAGAA